MIFIMDKKIQDIIIETFRSLNPKYITKIIS